MVTLNLHEISEMVTKIVQQVVKENFERSMQKKRLLVIHPRTEEAESKLSYLYSRYHVDEWNGQLIEELFLDNYDYFVFLEVDQQLIASGAIGLANNIVEKILSELLLRDKKILLFPQDSFYRLLFLDQPNVYKKMFHSYIEKLQQFGCRFSQLSNIYTILDEEENKNLSNEKSQLITAAFIETYDNHILQISKNMIITPLALDAAKTKGIKVMYD